MCAWNSRLAVCCPLLAGVALLVSCDTPRKRALRELAKAGVEVSGYSLVQAVLRQDIQQAGWLLDAGVHTEQRDARGRTPLRIAIDGHDIQAASLLIAARANVNATTADQVSVLGVAVAEGNPPVIEDLLAAGADAGGRMPDGETILPWAIRQGRLTLVQMMMQAGADPHLTDRQGNPLLHVAMECGRRDLVDALITLGADAGALDARGESTLHFALRRSWHDAIPRLIAGGADPNLPNPAGLTPLESALATGDAKLLDILLKSGADPNLTGKAGVTPLERALAARDLGLLEKLLKSGADPNRAGPDGLTPLARVIAARDSGSLGVLLASGADPNRVDAANGTAVHAALRSRWLEGLRVLARAGADFERPDAAGITPLQRAFAGNDRELAGLLLSFGVDPACRNARNELLVELAVAAGWGSLVKLLLDYGSPAGNALSIACSRGDGGMAGLLLACGVAPNTCRVPSFDPPLGAALRARNDALAAALVSHGAAVNTCLAEGQSPLHLAIATGCHRTVKRLLDAGANPNAPFRYPVSPAFIRQVRPGAMQWELRMDKNLTPLMLAADSGVPQSAVHLIAAGAKKSVSTRLSQLGPLNFAAQREDVRMMRALLGQDPDHEERRIVVSLSEQCARMFDTSGNEVFKTKVSTGRSGFATRTGDFVITDKYRTWTSTIYHASMPFFQRLSCSDFGLHQGYAPGYPASHGCIRVPGDKASQLFDLTRVGDRVQIIP